MVELQFYVLYVYLYTDVCLFSRFYDCTFTLIGSLCGLFNSIKKIVELVTSESNESQQSTVAKTSLSELEDQIAEVRMQ